MTARFAAGVALAALGSSVIFGCTLQMPVKGNGPFHIPEYTLSLYPMALITDTTADKHVPWNSSYLPNAGYPNQQAKFVGDQLTVAGGESQS